MNQVKIPAVYMRGGTSKGVFFRTDSLPEDAELRDRILLRVIGSPDRYGQQIDGMGGATSSTSKVMLVGPSSLPDCDIDYSFGQVAIDKAIIDWSGNCGNLTSAVGPFAIAQGIVGAPSSGIASVRMRHTSLNARIVAHIPMMDGDVVEDGDYELDGVTFPAAEIRVEFLESEAQSQGHGMFPTGNAMDVLKLPGLGDVEATMIFAGNPAVFVDAAQIGMRGDEMQKDVNEDLELLAILETVRAHAAVRMGLAATVEEATLRRLHTPKLCFVSPPLGYKASSGKMVDPTMIDLNARILSMGKLHHAMTGTGAIALGVAAAIPGTVIHRLLGKTMSGVRFGHPSGVMMAGAVAEQRNGTWVLIKAVMSRSARRLMEGNVLVPAALFGSLK
ncbi:2-methylaconitate cis-trans isomerase PrpF [Terriglobus saanensis]|uniref:AcnD-accessory protein PrpF n=1 Tax=Terriglobus saanensis (strain ATCC BAA-1853 / DSM 23119 / SP1PR4) TaxID=401053 RepID=E8V3F9_TERSS|nr:2-methylaconitate cis-trans isomerase PrpF [Terriglobus saanensis]ADV83572.1 AcnD-accessory protein PrpF [Terriglobus saanensis SP1PR4]